MDRVVFDQPLSRAAVQPENPQLLNVVEGLDLNCFADAWYRGAHYCVPNEGSENTKRIFTLLRAVLALNLAATDLNPTPTIRVTP